MLQSSSDTTTTSPTPISPFSSYSVRSEATSDELPDLGAFTTVFRALNHLQTPRALALPPQLGGTATPLSLSEIESDAPGGSTVWAHRPIASYLTNDQDIHEIHSRGSNPITLSDDDSASGSDTEGEAEGQTVEIEDISDIEEGDQPSLGYLDEALSFIAAERAKFTLQREAGTKGNGTISESAWRHVVEPRRKRRRKRKVLQLLTKDLSEGLVPVETTEVTVDADQDADQDADDSSSSFEQSPSVYFKSTPTTPARTRKEKQKQRSLAVDSNRKLSHSKSTPSLRISLTIPPDPRILQLRSLAHKLRLLFPENTTELSAILSSDFPNSADILDPRGPVPQSQDTLIHVFIDHSNILIGLLTYMKRYLRHPLRKPKRLSHAALALILERGRPISRRVLVTSSPLYQPMESAEQLGYEVRVYARVPDMGDGQDRRQNNIVASTGGGTGSGESSKSQWRKSYTKTHSRTVSGGTSTESETSASANTASFPQAFARSLGAGRPANNLPSSSNTTGNGNSNTQSSTSATRIRYREQGVDELLQLKLHQAIADVDMPPPNATIVLATGDGNVGQFNEDGFLGPVRTALKKGWKVELYAWEEGLSKAWMREFGEGPFKERFRIIGMEQFGADMLEV